MTNNTVLKSQKFVDYVIGLQTIPGKLAKMKKADNPDTSYMAWALICNWCGDDFIYTDKRTPYEVVGAAIARAKIDQNGTLNLGQALARCNVGQSDDDNDPNEVRLRRALSCTSVEEVCSVVRPILSLISSKCVSLDYAGLLNDLLFFGDKVKQKWALGYYRANWKEESNVGDKN